MTLQEKLNLLKSITEADYCNIAGHDWPSFQELTVMNEVPDVILDRVSSMALETKQRIEKSSKFCALAFHGREYRRQLYAGHRHDVLACCGLTPDQIQPVLNNMLQGAKHMACNSCWSLESKGIQSLREIKNSTLDNLLDLDIVTMYENAAGEKAHPVYMYKIETNNICNSTCVTCSSKYSSAWKKLEQDNAETPYSTVRFLANNQGLYFDKKSLDHQEVFPIDYANAKFINFFGGEPTYDPTVYTILRQLVEHRNTNCFISFTTHGNFDFTIDQKNLISKFPRMHINFSIDAIDKKFEYVRYPLSWEKLNRNIKWCRDQGIEISANWTLSSLTMFYFDEIKTWFKDNNLNYRLSLSTNFKRDPDNSYNVLSLSQRVKDIVIKHNRSNEVGQLLSSHQALDDYAYNTLLLDLSKQDRWKNISIYDYMPEFAEVIHQDLVKYKC
jgi:MoaA/NifB/PqqE/SkfB family radical SAM enzyme